MNVLFTYFQGESMLLPLRQQCDYIASNMAARSVQRRQLIETPGVKRTTEP